MRNNDRLGKVMNATENVSDFISELAGIEHIVAMHILIETSIIFYEEKLKVESSYKSITEENYFGKILNEKIESTGECRALYQKLMINIKANNDENPDVYELRINFPYFLNSIKNRITLNNGEIEKISSIALGKMGQIKTKMLPPIYSVNSDALRANRVAS